MMLKINLFDENKMNATGGIVTLILGFIISKLGALAIPIGLLFALMPVDYITGILAAKKRGEIVSSRRGIEGIYKKLVMATLVFVGAGFDLLLKYVGGQFGFENVLPFACASIICVWLVSNEFISIFENAAVLGVKIPGILKAVKGIRKKVENILPSEESENTDINSQQKSSLENKNEPKEVKTETENKNQ